MGHGGPGGQAEHLGREVQRVAHPGRTVVEFARVGLGVGDQLLDRSDRQTRVHHDHDRRDDGVGERHEVPQRIV